MSIQHSCVSPSYFSQYSFIMLGCGASHGSDLPDKDDVKQRGFNYSDLDQRIAPSWFTSNREL